MTVKQLESRVAYLELVMGINTELVITLRDIIDTVSQVYDMSMREIKTRNRSKIYVEPRKMLCFLAHYYRVAGCVELAKILQIDHTSVIHSRNCVKDLLQVNDPEVTPKFLQCKQILESC